MADEKNNNEEYESNAARRLKALRGGEESGEEEPIDVELLAGQTPGGARLHLC